MGLARLVVIEGPDLGLEFEIPLRGGGIGRGEGNVVQLSDLSVSRNHCRLELRDGRLALIDHGSRNSSLVNGAPVSTHLLEAGDEIVVGKTRLSFLPVEGGVAVMRQALPSRVTMEIGSRELLQARRTASPAAGDERARRHLAAVANLGSVLRDAGDRDGLADAVCNVTLGALGAERAFLLGREPSGRMSPIAAAVGGADAEGTQLSLPREVIDKVLREGKAIALDQGGRSARPAVAAPLSSAGLLYADRRAGSPPWDGVDLMAVACLAHLAAGALASLEARAALAADNQSLEQQVGGRELVGSSPRARQVLAFVAKVGPSDATVLLTGESGSGKEMVARAIHRASRRSRSPFIAVNCAALTETLIESELFGHEKGAFTGATERKAGRFELADKGTLFLDEVGELPLGCQTKFLRVLEEQRFERVGSGRSISVDVRVVAATNRDLAAMVRRGEFREDLYYRLSVIHAVVPPLRERAEDIPVLAEHFLARLKHQVARRVSGFSPEAIRALVAHPWPGNVRELKNAIERAIVLGEGELIRVEDLPPSMSGAPLASYTPPTAPFAAAPLPGPTPGAVPAAAAPVAARPLRELEREGIITALAATGGNKAQAAAILEIDRSTLYKKIKDYKIDV